MHMHLDTESKTTTPSPTSVQKVDFLCFLNSVRTNEQGQVHQGLTFLILFATAEALAAQVEQEHFDKGLIYPPFSNIRNISANIAAKVAAKAYELGKLLSGYQALSYLHCPALLIRLT